MLGGDIGRSCSGWRPGCAREAVLMIRPQPLRFIAGNASADRVEGRGQVDGDDRIPFLGREFLDRRDVLDAGIVDQDVDGAELVGAALTIASICVGRDMSAPSWIAPSSLAARARSPPASPKPLSISLAPSPASALAMPRPMPEVDPVTSATLPSRIISFSIRRA